MIGISYSCDLAMLKGKKVEMHDNLPVGLHVSRK
jgi:hypothetical protein